MKKWLLEVCEVLVSRVGVLAACAGFFWFVDFDAAFDSWMHFAVSAALLTGVGFYVGGVVNAVLFNPILRFVAPNFCAKMKI